MSTHVLTTYDEKNYYISEEQAKKARDRWNNKKTIEFLNYPGEIIMPGNVAAIGPKQAKAGAGYGPHSPLNAAAVEVFQLAQTSFSKEPGFWQQIFRLNMERKANSKPWLFEAVIEKAQTMCSFTEPGDLVAFIESEWEELAQYNRPKKI